MSQQPRIGVDDLTGPDILALLTAHLAEMRAHSPADSMHALDPGALRAPGVTVWSMRDATVLLGCGALKELDAEHGEIKSMRTAPGHTGRGVGAALLAHIINVAQDRGYRRLSLETGAAPYYAPAQRLYERHGFVRCPPFGEYIEDTHSMFFTLAL
ncbi:GNAT family N-acetyltransferase [Nocardia puris]|uniref:Putative acetyltransferase n=1 Tax=Nocardia puris TaxID=208602 RepID=A0A366E4N2_9NOCA|nr:GNAT family N-acetyltransferase [Nocardia puris]MBF6212705.1 GNAT family N-acetyltransferase [Nocardia puris]MBF6367643.1 GNAT family N-acetyltransferase [Nocardia puris]MBF6461294.1 GNAT family N-acetyltransferase [Nocardia puris]RBO96474.1 putative acetyltransferase [Nocardia puris]